jgi:Bacterial cellulose synthase subunit
MMFFFALLVYFIRVAGYRRYVSTFARRLLRSSLMALALTSNAWAEQALLDADAQVKGTQGSMVLPLMITATTPKIMELKLRWTYSSLIDPKRSIVNIVINGQARSSRRLSDVGPEGWALNLRPLPAGRHDLVLQVHLRAKDEDCLPVPESLWLTFLQSSTIRGATRAGTSIAKQPVVRDYPMLWKNNIPPSLGTAQQPATHPIRLIHDFPWDAKMAAVYLQSQLLLRHLSIETRDAKVIDPVQGSLQNAADVRGQLQMRALDRLPPTHPAVARWKLSPETRFVLFTPVAGELEIIAKDTSGLEQALQLLANDSLRQLCHETICSSTAAMNDALAPKTATSIAIPQSLLWAMQTGDQPRGWTAQGAGVHKLRQVWLRPATLDLQSDVQLHLAARISQASQIDSNQSSVSVRINDQNLATYSLADWKSTHAKIRIPQSLWTARVWVLDFEVRLVPRATQRCSFLVQEDFWATIDPQTRLEAKFKQQDGVGIAGFWHRSMERTVQPVVWPIASGSPPQPHQLAQLSPLLVPFASPRQGAQVLRWTFVEPTACRTAACIVLHAADDRDKRSEHLLQWKAALKKIPSQAQSLPDLRSAGTALIAWTAQELHLVVGQPSSARLPVPQLAAFTGPVAVHTDQWQFFPEESALDTADGSASKGQGNVSQQQGRLRWVNLIWALLSVVICTVLAVLFWRKKKKPDAKTWEVS